MALIVLGVLLGTAVFIAALIAKKWGLAKLALPCPLLVLLWLVLAGTPPDAEAECKRLFGEEVRAHARELQSIKPPGMDGFFLTFRISPQDFQHLIKPAFSVQPISGISFFGRESRPEGWPKVLETIDECLQRDVGEDSLCLYYDDARETAYASFRYWGW
ncbi:hypothetical protein [Prosthecobacter sp.]|uniref:hypothetical protein n=1 Tax=Prosthecobacter sp. TaxID=1965333 RepID=UPI003783F518